MFSINNNRLQVLFAYTYEMSKNISPKDGGIIEAGGDEISDVYRAAINALAKNKKISEYFEESGIYNKYFEELIVPSISEQIEPVSNKEDYIKSVLLQYSADLAHYFKKSSHFVKKEVTLESLQPYRKEIEHIFNASLEDLYQRISNMNNSLNPFSSRETEKLFKTEFDMDIESFYHNAALTILGNPLSSTIDDNLMESTFNQIKAAIEEYEQGHDINYDGILISNDGDKKPYR